MEQKSGNSAFLLTKDQLFRHHIVISGASSYENTKHIRIVTALTIFSTIYCIFLFLLLASYDLPSFSGIEICLNGDNGRAPSNLIVLFILPNILAVMIPVAYDFRTHQYIKRHSGNPNSGSNAVVKTLLLQLPLRATMLSTLMALFFIVIGIIPAIKTLPKDVGAYTVSTLALLVVVFRFPIVTVILFRSNAINVATKRDDERERKRQIEMKSALERREKNRNGKNTVFDQNEAVNSDCSSKKNEPMPSIDC